MTARMQGGRRRDSDRWPKRFHRNFLSELVAAGYSPRDITRFVWKPFVPQDLEITGPGRHRSFELVEAKGVEVAEEISVLKKGRVDVEKAMGLADRFSPLAAPLGVSTDQERGDLLSGVESLGHAVRASRSGPSTRA